MLWLYFVTARLPVVSRPVKLHVLKIGPHSEAAHIYVDSTSILLGCYDVPFNVCSFTCKMSSFCSVDPKNDNILLMMNCSFLKILPQ